MKNPKRASLAWASEIRNRHFGLVLLEMFVYYMAVNLIFSTAYLAFNSLEETAVFFDYVYFSFVTSLSIGYGDLVPINEAGKVLIIIQTSITTVYFALMVSVLSLKLLYPRDLIRFSEKIIYNPKIDMFIIRVINTSRDALVNPNIRISVTEHNTGNESAGMINIPIDYNLVYLGKYDFSYTFKNSYKSLNVMNEVNKAIEYNKTSDDFQSRFRINVSLTGSYGFNQLAIYKKYYAKDIVLGNSFKPITYNKDFYGRKGDIKYNKIKNYWNDFEDIDEFPL
jgi:hypothetical protein